jgi:hypothetical protein
MKCAIITLLCLTFAVCCLGQEDLPKVSRPKTILDQDHEFDAGSGVSVSGLSSVQVKNLVLLGKVWGFLKYHYPEITNGKRHWDYDLFRVLPAVLAAGDRAAANSPLGKPPARPEDS